MQKTKNGATATATLDRTRNDLPESKRKQVVDLLNARLADAIDLRLQAKQAHWNVKGVNFYALHQLFDTIATLVNEFVDEIAERAVALGGTADGTVATVAKESNLPDYPTDIKDWRDHVETLADSMATFGKLIRSAIDEAEELGDADTNDLFVQISRAIDKHLWFLEAHLQGER